MEAIVPSHLPASSDASTVMALGPEFSIISAKTAGVPLYPRRCPMHCIFLGLSRIIIDGASVQSRTIAIPANVRHQVLEFGDTYACVAYLDPRRFEFASAIELARRWTGFLPGQDDIREAYGDALRQARPRVELRLLRALDAIRSGMPIPAVADRIGLSPSRMTHFMTDSLGAPPQTWRTWFRLCNAIGEVLSAGSTLTRAAHEAGFSDSAHLTRSCKQLMGVSPAMMMPQTVYFSTDS